MSPTILEFCRALRLGLSPMQETILAAAYALPPTPAQRTLFEQGTGLDPEHWPTEPVSTVVVIAGRGSGKDSRLAVPIALYESLFGPEPEQIGEQPGTIVLVGQNERAVKGVTFRYLRDYVKRSPMIGSQVEEILSNTIRFKSGLTIETLPSTADAPRGYHMPVAVLNEVGVWRLEGRVDSDREILAAVQARSDKQVVISTPFLQSGVLFDFSKRFGKPEPGLLVWKVPTAVMVPSLAAKVEKRRRLMDPELARREFDAEFISGLGQFLTHDQVSACIAEGIFEREPQPRVTYFAALDLSGGRSDRSALAVCHVDGERIIQDALKVWDGKTSREGVVAQAAAELRRYGLRRVFGDNYAANWVLEPFAKYSVRYISTGELKGNRRLTRSDAYVETEPLIRAGRLALLDDREQAREFLNLVRRDLPGGKFRVDHPSGEHDDRANACALAVALAERSRVREDRERRQEREDERPVGYCDEDESVYDADLAELIRWARPLGLVDMPTCARLDDGPALSQREQEHLCVGLVDNRCALDPAWAWKLRLERAGVLLNEPDDDEEA